MERRARDPAAAFARIARRYGQGLPARKLALLSALARARLPGPAQVRRLHEDLCFLEAYPDDARVHRAARAILRAFRDRADLRRHRQALTGSGIAGTDTPFRFFWPTARWIAEVWPSALVLERDDDDHARAILGALPQLLEPAQAEWLRGQRAPTLAVLDRLRPVGVTDADFLIGLVGAMPWDEPGREAFFDHMDPPFVLRAGRGTPERTASRLLLTGIACRPGGPDRSRPDLRAEAGRAPRRARRLRAGESRALIRLARFSMITRERDVAVFQYPDTRDAFLVDDGGGLAFALTGFEPSRRALLPATYAGLTLQNGVPVGYVQLDVLGRHAAISFNTFETFRGGEAARVFARLIAAARHVFGCDHFSVEPYQLGDANDEGIDSGAWWFYRRFGFGPRVPATRRLAAREDRRREARPAYRSSRRTLLALARSHLFFSLDPRRPTRLPRTEAWFAGAVAMLRRFDSADPGARQAAAVRAATRRLGIALARVAPAARAMLARWAGLALALTSQGRWDPGERRALGRLIVAKAGPAERDFQRMLLRHGRLRKLLDC